MSRSKPYGWIFILLFFGTLALTGQTSLDLADIPPFVKRNLQRDAARLYLRSIQLDDNKELQEIKIPQAGQQSFFQILQTLYLGNPTAKALLDCRFHTAAYPEIASIQVILAKNAQGKSGIPFLTKSSIIALDSLLYNYSLQIEGSTQWNVKQDVLHLRSRVPLNMEALSRKIAAIDGVEKVIFPKSPYYLTDIQIMRENEHWKVLFLAFDAQQNQPTHTWSFILDQHGEILTTLEGDSLPSWIKCQIP